MDPNPSPSADAKFINRTLEAAIRIGLVAILALYCFQITRPFIIPIMWGIIIAVAAHPAYLRIRTVVGGNAGLAAVIFGIIGMLILILPMIPLGSTLISGAQQLAEDFSDGKANIPTPPASVADWPLIGERLHDFWLLASTNLATALNRVESQVQSAGTWLLATAAGTGFALLQFIIAIVIAAVLLANGEGSAATARAVAIRFAGERGEELADLANATIRSVTRGILGVALIQSLLAGLGFLVVGIPGAGLLALVCLLLAVIQIGLLPILIPICIYVFSTADTLVAVVFLVWSIFVGVLDNVLKPLLLGRGARVPMVVIFVGAIGGFLYEGIIGLFVGAVILTLGYELFIAWLNETPTAPGPDQPREIDMATSRPQADGPGQP